MLGPTGVGKSFVACALAQKACRDGYSALYTRAAALFRDLALARADGSLRNLLARFSRIDVLVIDDWAMAPLAETERRDFWEICEDRYQTRSTILKVSKDRNRVEGRVWLSDKKPAFAIDPVTATVYVRTGPQEVSAFKP